jgi:hypothetical protein
MITPEMSALDWEMQMARRAKASFSTQNFVASGRNPEKIVVIGNEPVPDNSRSF